MKSFPFFQKKPAQQALHIVLSSLHSQVIYDDDHPTRGLGKNERATTKRIFSDPGDCLPLMLLCRGPIFLVLLETHKIEQSKQASRIHNHVRRKREGGKRVNFGKGPI